MKNLLPTLASVMLLVLMLPASVAAQTEMTIPWTGMPGELETTIVADTMADGTQAHDVYILEKGRVYLQIDPIDVNGSFTVRGQMFDPADPADVPATIQPLPGPDGVSRYVVWPGAHFNLLGDGATLRLENLLFNGAMADQSTHVWSIALTFGSDQRVEVENNVWSDYQMTLMSQGSNSDFVVNNTIVKAVPSYPGGIFFNGFIWGGGSWLGTIDTLVVTNSSVMNFWGEAIVIYEQVTHGLVDHTSFVNMVMRPIFNRGGNNMTFSNNLMYNTKIFGQSTYFYGLWGSIDGGSGVMDINYQDPPDSAAMAAGRHWDHLNRNIVWHNNAWVNDEQVLDFWQKGPWEWEVINAEGETEVRRDTMLAIEIQNKFVGDSTLALMAADPSIMEYARPRECRSGGFWHAAWAPCAARAERWRPCPATPPRMRASTLAGGSATPRASRSVCVRGAAGVHPSPASSCAGAAARSGGPPTGPAAPGPEPGPSLTPGAIRSSAAVPTAPVTGAAAGRGAKRGCAPSAAATPLRRTVPSASPAARLSGQPNARAMPRGGLPVSACAVPSRRSEAPPAAPDTQRWRRNGSQPSARRPPTESDTPGGARGGDVWIAGPARQAPRAVPPARTAPIPVRRPGTPRRWGRPSTP